MNDNSEYLETYIDPDTGKVFSYPKQKYDDWLNDCSYHSEDFDHDPFGDARDYCTFCKCYDGCDPECPA